MSAFFPSNYSRIWVRGTFIDLGGDPMQGKVTFSPSPAVLLNSAARFIIGTKPFDTLLDPYSGYFAIQLPATDDPDITPVNFTYLVSEPTGRKYNITVPYNTPILNEPGNPLHGQQVIDLIDIVPTPQASAGYVQVIAGVNGTRWYFYGGGTGNAQPNPADLNVGDVIFDMSTGAVSVVSTEEV